MYLNRFSVVEVLWQSAFVLWGARWTVLRIGWAPATLYIAAFLGCQLVWAWMAREVGLAGSAPEGTPFAAAMRLMPYMMGTALLSLLVPYFVRWHRYILLGPGALVRQPIYGEREERYLITAMIVTFTAFATAFALLVILLLGSGITGVPAIWGLPLLLLVPYVMARYAPALPAVATDETIALAIAFEESKPVAIRLTVALLLGWFPGGAVVIGLGLPVVGLPLGAEDGTTTSTLLRGLTGAGATLISVTYVLTILTLIFRDQER